MSPNNALHSDSSFGSVARHHESSFSCASGGCTSSGMNSVTYAVNVTGTEQAHAGDARDARV
jgi:hypothetical protein